MGGSVTEELELDWPPSEEDVAEARLSLAKVLAQVERFDLDYEPRYTVILTAMAVASIAGYKTGIAFDPAEPDWPAVYIELPTGQVSWHMPRHEVPWDGHSTPEKYERISKFVAECGS